MITQLIEFKSSDRNFMWNEIREAMRNLLQNICDVSIRQNYSISLRSLYSVCDSIGESIGVSVNREYK